MTAALAAAPVTIPDWYRNAATQLIADLASAAGDNPAAFDVMERHLAKTDPDEHLAVAVAALVITFSECITDRSTDPVPVTWPDTTQGETT